MRLIDADALPMHKVKIVHAFGIVEGNVVLPDSVSKAPTIDAVEVVRCRECKERWETLMLNDGWVHCKKWGMPTKSDGFCHEGAKMDGGAS